MMHATAERLPDLAEPHMRNAGHGGFSFLELAAEIGIKSASVHHYLPTKASKAAAVARRYGNRFFVAVDRTPEDLLRAIAQLRVRKTRFGNGSKSAGSAAKPARRTSWIRSRKLSASVSCTLKARR
jgi:AcrR family transcriptional regulator